MLSFVWVCRLPAFFTPSTLWLSCSLQCSFALCHSGGHLGFISRTLYIIHSTATQLNVIVLFSLFTNDAAQYVGFFLTFYPVSCLVAALSFSLPHNPRRMCSITLLTALNPIFRICDAPYSRVNMSPLHYAYCIEKCPKRFDSVSNAQHTLRIELLNAVRTQYECLPFYCAHKRWAHIFCGCLRAFKP